MYRSHVGAGHGRQGMRSIIRGERRRGGALSKCSTMICLAILTWFLEDNGTFLRRLQDTDLGQKGGVAVCGEGLWDRRPSAPFGLLKGKGARGRRNDRKKGSWAWAEDLLHM